MWPFKKIYKLRVNFTETRGSEVAIRTMTFGRIPCVGEKITIRHGDYGTEGTLTYEITDVVWDSYGDWWGNIVSETTPLITAKHLSHVEREGPS